MGDREVTTKGDHGQGSHQRAHDRDRVDGDPEIALRVQEGGERQEEDDADSERLDEEACSAEALRPERARSRPADIGRDPPDRGRGSDASGAAEKLSNDHEQRCGREQPRYRVAGERQVLDVDSDNGDRQEDRRPREDECGEDDSDREDERELDVANRGGHFNQRQQRREARPARAESHAGLPTDEPERAQTRETGSLRSCQIGQVIRSKNDARLRS